MTTAKKKVEDYEIKLDVVVNESEAVALAKQKVAKSYDASDLVLINYAIRKTANGGGYTCVFGVKQSLVGAPAQPVANGKQG